MNDYSPDEPFDAVDEAVLRRLGSIVATLDPVPADLADRSLFAMTIAALETEVMSLELVREPVGSVRGDVASTQARTITFTSAALTVMITLSPSAVDAVRIDGWVAPTGELEVELHRPGADVRTARTDEDGRFSFDAVPHGAASLVARPASAGAVSTPVIEI